MTQVQTKRIRRMAAEELQSGDQMTREEFHRVYEKMPEDFKAELIGGIVYVASPLKHGHGNTHLSWGTLLGMYEAGTPGVDAGDNATVLLGEDSEPQPDLYLRVLRECGGQSRVNKNDYIQGAPELIVEVAYSSRAIDLHTKREDYARYGVWEYLVASLGDERIYWFDLRKNKELSADKDGIIRVRSFPGLWIDGKAMFSRNLNRLLEVLRQGMSTAEHTEFVKRLDSKRK